MHSFEGEDHQIVYYKNSRPASIRRFDAAGRLNRIEYLDRNGSVFRFDSLVYKSDRMVSGHYYLEPGRIPVLHFYNNFRGRQLESRHWVSDADSLYCTERFVFDRKGNRVLYVVIDASEQFLVAEAYHPGGNERHFRNVYSRDSLLVEQTTFIQNRPHRVFSFDRSGRVSGVERMGSESRALIRSQLYYDALGRLSRERLVNSRGADIAILPADVLHNIAPTNWKHPFQPAFMPRVLIHDYPDPLLQDPIKKDERTQGYEVDLRLTSSAQLVVRKVFDENGLPLRDSLYAGGARALAGTVIQYDSLGWVRSWQEYDESGRMESRLQYYRDTDQRVIREELFQPADHFSGAITRFYDALGKPYLSEVIGEKGRFETSHYFFEGGAVKLDYIHDRDGIKREKLVTRVGGDTLQHLFFDKVAYFWIETAVDPAGTVLYQRRYTDNGLLNWQVHFDPQGRPTMEEHRKLNGTLFKGIQYDSEKRTWTSLLISPDGEVTGEEVHKVDSLGREIQVISKDVNGRKAWERRYAYRKGKLLKSAQLDADNKPIQITDYSYDKAGKRIKELARTAGDSTLYTIEYRYDAEGHMILETFRSNIENIVNSRRFYHDELDRVGREEIIEDHQLKQVITYSYYPEYRLRIADYRDLNGELLRQEVQNEFGENIFAEYEFAAP